MLIIHINELVVILRHQVIKEKENWSMHRTKLFYFVFGKEDNEENGSQVDERIFKVHINEEEG